MREETTTESPPVIVADVAISTDIPAPGHVGDFASILSHADHVSVSEAPSVSRYQEDFQKLQELARTGPPRTLGDRYKRQVFADRLDLAPIAYNLLVFGEAPAPTMKVTNFLFPIGTQLGRSRLF